MLSPSPPLLARAMHQPGIAPTLHRLWRVRHSLDYRVCAAELGAGAVLSAKMGVNPDSVRPFLPIEPGLNLSECLGGTLTEQPLVSPLPARVQPLMVGRPRGRIS